MFSSFASCFMISYSSTLGKNIKNLKRKGTSQEYFPILSITGMLINVNIHAVR